MADARSTVVMQQQYSTWRSKGKWLQEFMQHRHVQQACVAHMPCSPLTAGFLN
jgi:hypothetical protein